MFIFEWFIILCFILIFMNIKLNNDIYVLINNWFLFGGFNIKDKYLVVVFIFKLRLVVRYLRWVLLEVCVKLKE